MIKFPARVDALLIAGGKYHDFDHARRELLGLMAEHDHVRTTVDSTYENVEALERCSLLVSYTCDVRPSEQAQAAVRSWVVDYHPSIERCSWEKPQYHELPRRAIRWGLGHQS